MTSLAQDIRYAARRLKNAPGFTAVAVATLALGIGATVAVFSIVYGVLLKPLPYADPGRLVLVTSAQKGRPRRDVAARLPGLSEPEPQLRRDGGDGRHHAESHAERRGAGAAPPGAGERELLRPDGRARDARPDLRARTRIVQGAPRTIVLGYGTWRDVFAGDTAVIGRTVTLNGNPSTVIGVAPSWMHYPKQAQGWVPMVWTADELDPANRGAHSIGGVARLKRRGDGRRRRTRSCATSPPGSPPSTRRRTRSSAPARGRSRTRWCRARARRC